MSTNLQFHSTNIASNQQKLIEVWEEHTRCEFERKNVDETMETMTANPYVYNVPTMAGGAGYGGVYEFYSKSFIPMLPPDTETASISRTVGENQIVDELIFKFTHTVQMDWMLPGVAPTGKRVEVALVALVRFDNAKISHEHIYWDQASVLAQLGLINKDILPISGIESARTIGKFLKLGN